MKASSNSNSNRRLTSLPLQAVKDCDDRRTAAMLRSETKLHTLSEQGEEDFSQASMEKVEETRRSRPIDWGSMKEKLSTGD
nr:hypothetical protein Itr_chr03CG18370 [Ipomoea trifida]GMC70270.1 hypothetical protein Iba_chr03aCG14370 [Ipomoea batatas]